MGFEAAHLTKSLAFSSFGFIVDDEYVVIGITYCILPLVIATFLLSLTEKVAF